jgi:DNA-binding MarR family transcriptional regulator
MDPKHDLVEHIVRRLRRIIDAHLRIEDLPVPVGPGVSLSTREVHCLTAIGDHEGANIKTVGDALGVTKSAASQMVTKLVARGFAVKRPANDNDKDICAFLTAEGWEAFRAHRDFHERHMDTLLHRLAGHSPEQLATVAEVLDQVEDVMHERMAELFGR